MSRPGSKHSSIFEKRTLNDLIAEVQAVYLADTRPWVVGYSGGKDSTATAQLVYMAIEKLSPEKRHKKIHIISSDTLVETPVVVDHIFGSMKLIGEDARKKGLPIDVTIVKPATSETFWVNILGKGYPAPNNQFRWCTDRMKIKPANRFILDQVAEHGEAVVVLGVRMNESATRNQVINSHKIPGQLLSRHSTLPNAFVYSPVIDFTTDDIWHFLLQAPSPWGGDNRRLVTLYRNAQQGECPLVIDTTTPSCGNSRFGCWTCTVVTADRSMEAMIENGEEWMEPLLEFRGLLASTQDPSVKEVYREHKRRNGRVELKTNEEDGIIYGPYKFEFRKELLEKLLTIQRDLIRQDRSFQLITIPELLEIRRLWQLEQQDWADSVSLIYQRAMGKPLEILTDDVVSFSPEDQESLKQLSNDSGLPWQMVAKLLDVERLTPVPRPGRSSSYAAGVISTAYFNPADRRLSSIESRTNSAGGTPTALAICSAFSGLTPFRPFSMSQRLATDSPTSFPNSRRLISSDCRQVRRNSPTDSLPNRFSKSRRPCTLRFSILMLVDLQNFD